MSTQISGLKDNRLFEAAITGDTSLLHQLLDENPMIFADSSLINPHDNPLHIATKAGHLGFVQEMIRLRPESITELDKDGFRPLDIASALGHIEIVKEMSTTGTARKEIYGLKGREGRTAFHYAAINGKVEVMDELVSSRAECIKDVTSLGETALHLTVKYYKFEAFSKLIDFLEIHCLQDVVNWGDEDGNTVLHLIVSRKQHEYVKLLLGNSGIASKLDINAKNNRCLTAMDIMEILLENPSDVHLHEILKHAGAVAAMAISPTPSASQQQQQHVSLSVVGNNQDPEHPSREAEKKDWIKYFRFQQQRDSPSDTRNALLVVAALIATCTFQAGVNPPEKHNKSNPNSTNSPAPSPSENRHPVLLIGGIFALIGSVAAEEWFLLGNSLGLAASICVIIYLTAGFPFQRELHISMYSMLFAYGWAIQNIDSEGSTKQIFLGLAFVLPFLLRWLPRWAKRIWRRCKQKARGEHQVSTSSSA